MLYYADQDLINAYCDPFVLDSRYNCLAKWYFSPGTYGVSIANPVVLHYAGQSRKYYVEGN